MASPLCSVLYGAMSWQAFVKEVEGLHTFIESQKKIIDKKTLEEVMHAHVQQIIGRSNLTCNADNASDFVTLISTGPWSDDQKKTLGTWVHGILMGSASQQKSPKREPQMVDTFANYFSQNDLKILSDKENGIHAKLDCVFAALSEPAHGMNFWKLYHVVLFHKITVTTPAKYQFKRAEVSPEE